MRAGRTAAATAVVLSAMGAAHFAFTDAQPGPLAIESVMITPGSPELVLYIDGCADGVFDTEVEEDATSVTVTVRAEAHQERDCLDYAVVELETFIDDRALIDGSNGKRLG